MAKAQSTASKQRKSRKPEVKKVTPEIVSEVNERQIASGSLSSTGEIGADAINRISDWLQANGKIVVGILVLAVLGGVIYITTTITGVESESKFTSALLKAGSTQEPDEVREKFAALAEDASGDSVREADFHYHYAKALWAALEDDAGRDAFPKEEDRKDTLEQIGLFISSSEKVEGSAYESRVGEMKALKTLIESRARDYTDNARLRAFKQSEFNEKQEREPKIVSSPENPVLAFETTTGDFKIELYEEALLQNSINTLVTLTQREYYDGANPELIKRPGVTSSSETLLAGASLIGFGQKGMLEELPDEDAKKDEDKEADDKKKINPYFFILPESMTGDRYSNRRGTVMLYFNPRNPHKRGPEFAVNLSDNTQLDGIYQVVGRVTDDAGLEALEAMTRGDVVLDAYVEQQRDRDYTPRVIFTEGPRKTGLPQLWTEGDVEPETPRIPRIDEPKIIDDKSNPMVVLSTERGDLLIELFEDKTPNTVANFIHLVESGHYKGSDFHRILTGDGKGEKIAQGGRREGSEDFDWTIKNEAVEESYAGLRNRFGTVAMARQNDLNTGGCQFFINLKDHPNWDKEDSPYCVFGRVVQNLWAADNIRKDDKILDAWVVQKRDHAYIPLVKFEGKSSYEPAVKEDE